MKTKMSAQSSADVAPSQTSVVSTTTTQSSVWSLCDISTDSHVDLRDITPSISPVFTDDQVHELTRNPNAVDVLDEHFLAPETLKRIDEVLNSEEQAKLLYGIATTAAAGTAPYSHNEAGSLKNNSDELLHAELNFPVAMFTHFDSMDNDNDRMMNKETTSLHPIPAAAGGNKVSQITQACDGDWQKDETASADGQEQRPGEQGDSDAPKGLRRSPRKRVPVNKDSNRTLALPSKPVSRGKDISKLKYVNVDKEKTKKEVAKKEVRRSGRMQKKAEKDESSEEKDSEEAKANTKRKTSKPKETEDDGKESSEKQDTASKNVRRSPRNQSKTPQEEKLKTARGKKGKLSENGNDNRKQKTVVSEMESSDEAAVMKKKTKVAKSEDEKKGENEKTESGKEVKEQDEQCEKMKSARMTRNTGNKDKEKEGEMGNSNVKRRRKKVENEGTETEEVSKKVEDDLVKSKKESGESKNDKSASEDDNTFSGVKENERQSEIEEKNSSEESDVGRTKRGKKDQAKAKETEIEKKGIEIENQGVTGRRGRKSKENIQQIVTKETKSEVMLKVALLKIGDKTTEEKPMVIKADSQENKSLKEELTSDTKGGDSSSTKQTEKTTSEKNNKKEVTTDEKHRDEQEGSDVESSENEEEFNEDSDYDPEYDPDRLWCVCRKPHGNRFMICCDHCEEWFHGACVGITMSQGRQMEKKGQEYICPKCKVKLQEETNQESEAVKPEQMHPSTPEKTKQDITSKKDHSPKLKMPDNKEGTRRRRHFVQRTSGGNVIKDEQRSKEESGDKEPSNVHGKEERKRKVHESTGFKIPKKVRTTPTPASHVTHPAQRKCIASGCTMLTYHDSLYCSQDCIARHAEESIRILTEERRRRMGAKVPGGSSKSATSPTSSLLGPVPWEANHAPASSYSEPSSKEGVAVIERSTGRVIAGVAAPSQEELVFWLQDHPMFEVLRPSGGKADKKKEKKEDSEKAVRENIKKSLKEILMARCKDQQDLSISEQEFQKCAVTVEEEMFSFFGDTGYRYKNKYRSLMFNLKDPRNKVLFRHVLSGEITVDKLVRMTPEQLASPELATWREQETKHTLEMIKQSQEEINATKAHIKKTHKGEVEIDGDDDLSSLENSMKAKSELNVEKDLPDSNNSSSTLLLDTTDEHRIHLFDLNCRICTGKIAPPGEPPRRETPAPLVSTTSIIQAVAESSIPSPTPMDVTSANSPDSASVSQLPLSPSQATKTQKKVPAVWKGFVMMQSVAKFGTNAYRVSGSCDDLLQLLPDTLHVQGRIAHEQVWDYLMQLKSSNSREVCVIRYEASSDEEKMSYVSLYSYFYSRSRCGVVSNCYTGVKDMYLVPLASHQPIPRELLPFNGPGLDEPRPHMLLGVIVRVKTLFKRPRALSQRSLSPPPKRRASSGSQETSSEGGAAESPANKRNEKVELHDSPPADIDDIVFQYHTSQAIRKVSKEPSGSPAKVSTPSDTSTPSLASSSGAVVYPTEQPVAMSLEAQKQHLLDLQERARQYILAQIQRKETSSLADRSEEAGQLKEETAKAREGEKQRAVVDDDTPYDPEEGLELDLDPPEKAEAVASDVAPSAPAVVVTTQEPTKPSSIQMLVSTLKKLQGAAVKSHSPQLSALSSVLSSQASSSNASIPQDLSNTSTVSATHPFQPTALAQTTVVGGQGHQSVLSAGILQPGGKSQSTASSNPTQPDLTLLTHRLLSAISTGRGTGSQVSSTEAFQSTGPNSRGQHGTVLPRHEPRSSASASVDSVGSVSQSAVLGGRLSELTGATQLGQQAPASVGLGPQSTFVTHPSALIGGGPSSRAPSGVPTGVLPASIGHGGQSSVSAGRDTYSAVSPGSYQRSTAAMSQRQQSAAQTGDPSNRWQPSEPPQVVRQVDTATQRVREYDNLRPEDRARLAAHESRLESREGRRFHGHDRDERNELGRIDERHRHDRDDRRYPRDFRPYESGNSWRGQCAPGRRWSDEERRRDRYERPMDNRSRPVDRRDERRFKEHWNRDKWRR